MKQDSMHPALRSPVFPGPGAVETDGGQTLLSRLQDLFRALPAPRLMITDTDPVTSDFFRQEELRCADSDRLLSGCCDTGGLVAAAGLKGGARLTLRIRFRAVFTGLPRLWFVRERRQDRLWKADPAAEQPLVPDREWLSGFDLTLSATGSGGSPDGQRLRWIAVGSAMPPRGARSGHA
jgi:hypothetical protein